MKKFLSTGIIVIMLLGLVACGQKENSNDNKAETVENIEVDNSIRNLSEEEKTKLVAETPELDLDNFWFTLDSNKAKAKTNYEGKIYKISLSVMNIETDYFENMTKDSGGVIRSIKVFLPTSELANLSNGQRLTFIGTIELVGNSINLKDAFVSSNYEEAKSFSAEEIEVAIENYGGTGGDGHIDWTEGSYPFFVENHENFEKVTKENASTVFEGTWKGKQYTDEDIVWTVTFTSDSTADVIKGNGDVYEWEYSFSGGYIKFPVKASNSLEVRKVSDNLIVFYANTVDYVPYWILYR